MVCGVSFNWVGGLVRCNVLGCLECLSGLVGFDCIIGLCGLGCFIEPGGFNTFAAKHLKKPIPQC